MADYHHPAHHPGTIQIVAIHGKWHGTDPPSHLHQYQLLTKAGDRKQLLFPKEPSRVRAAAATAQCTSTTKPLNRHPSCRQHCGAAVQQSHYTVGAPAAAITQSHLELLSCMCST